MIVEDVRYSYPRSGGRLALAGLSFESASKRIAILGPNGAGKSTLMSLLSTVRRPSSGHFVHEEFDSRSGKGLREYRAQLGVVPQHLAAFGGLTCREFLGYVSWLRAVPPRLAHRRISEAISAVGLEIYADQKLKSFSGGMRQRASLAQALVNDPSVLLLDEPTVSLDPAQRDAYLALLRDTKISATVIMTSHVVDDIAAFADDVVVVREGTCSFAGPLWSFCGSDVKVRPTGQQIKMAYVQLLDESGPVL